MPPPTNMTQDSRLASIPKGNTCGGVHTAVIEHLLASGRDMSGATMLDVSCGQGELISTLGKFFPGSDVRGCDLTKPKNLSAENFSPVDANRIFRVFPGMKFDFVFSVSGVMEFDNTLQFFETVHHHLKDRGQFIVTNDNILAMRDRIAYFWLGKVRQYQLFLSQGDPTWKVIPIHNMVRILQDAGFRIREVKYVSVKPKDWMLLPLALLVYPIQRLYTRFCRSSMRLFERSALYPFRSLIYRHYLIICEKVAA